MLNKHKRNIDYMELFDTLKTEVGEWSRKNFPDQPDVNPYIGSSEEMGELADRVDLSSEPDTEELDAVGDILIYLADFCYIRDLDYQKAYEMSKEKTVTYDDLFREWVVCRGKLSRSVLKTRQGIRLDEDRVGSDAELEALSEMLCCLRNFANKRGYTVENCIDVAWYDEVIDREWDSSYK